MDEKKLVPVEGHVADPIRTQQHIAEVAQAIQTAIRQQNLTVKIQGGEHVLVEGWAQLGELMNLWARERSVTEHKNGDWEAYVDLINRDGLVIGGGSAIVGFDEASWQKRPRFARRSMAITRAAGKAFRLRLGFVMKMAGFKTTPAEEMQALAEAGAAPRVELSQKPPEPVDAGAVATVDNYAPTITNVADLDGYGKSIQEQYKDGQMNEATYQACRKTLVKCRKRLQSQEMLDDDAVATAAAASSEFVPERNDLPEKPF